MITQGIQSISDEAAAAQDSGKAANDAKLDEVISGAMAKAEQPDPFEDYLSARAERDELKERHGTDTAGIVKTFVGYQAALAENPEVGAELIRGNYLSNSNLATMRHSEQADYKSAASQLGQAAPQQPEAKEFSGKILDRVLEGAIDEHYDGKRDRDRAEMEAALPLFEELKKTNPSLTWKEFFANTVHADRALWRNPENAYRLAAASGLPVTALQKEMASARNEALQQTNSLEALIADMGRTGELSNIDTHAPAMEAIMQRPDFVRTNDVRYDLHRANRLAEIFERERLLAVEKAQRAAPIKSSGGIKAQAPAQRSSLDGAVDSAVAALGY